MKINYLFRLCSFFLIVLTSIFIYACGLLASKFYNDIHISYDNGHGEQMGNFRITSPVGLGFVNTYWHHLKPCGQFIDEVRQFTKANKCVKESMQAEFQITAFPDPHLPRCYVLPYTAPSVLYNFRTHLNVVFMDGDRKSPIVGLYNTQTQTIFLVENYDIAAIYRHELQHFLMHQYIPEYFHNNGSHASNVWNDCEPDTYFPSEEQQKISESQLKLLEKEF